MLVAVLGECPAVRLEQVAHRRAGSHGGLDRVERLDARGVHREMPGVDGRAGQHHEHLGRVLLPTGCFALGRQERLRRVARETRAFVCFLVHGDLGQRLLARRRARLRLAAAGVLVWSVATVASGLAPTYAALLLARTVIGVGEASYAVVTPSLLSDLYPAERRARVFATFYAAIPAGTALGYAVGGTIGEAFGW